MKKIPLIVDCDPGIDDIVALLILYKHKNLFDIKLMSACSGNLDIDITTNNLRYFVKNFFDNTPVSKGYGKPLKLKFESDASFVHGKSGLGNFEIDNQDYPILPNQSHIEMFNILKSAKEPVTIMSIGPMTNIALLVSEFPEIKPKIKQIYCMIGSVNGDGNIKPYAEFNAYYDPHAFKIVSECGIPLVINPLELGVNTCLKKQPLLKEFGDSKNHSMIKQIVGGLTEPDDDTIVRLFDANTSLALIHPELFNFIPCDVTVSIDKNTMGQCFCKKNEKGLSLYQEPKDFETIKKYITEELKSC